MMNLILRFIQRLVEREEGQGMVEYGLILALVSVVVIVVLVTMGTEIRETMQSVVDALTGAGGAT